MKHTICKSFAFVYWPAHISIRCNIWIPHILRYAKGAAVLVHTAPRYWSVHSHHDYSVASL